MWRWLDQRRLKAALSMIGIAGVIGSLFALGAVAQISTAVVNPFGTAGVQPLRAAAETHIDEGKNYALVIGIDSFDNRAWPTLRGVEKEIVNVVTALSLSGFDSEKNITSNLENGRLARIDKEKLRGMIQAFLRDPAHNRPDARLVIYIATHGTSVTDSSTGRSLGFLVASNSTNQSERDFAGSAYSVEDLANELAVTSARHVMIFFDSCFSGGMVPIVATREGETGAARPKPLRPDFSQEVREWVDELFANYARQILTAGDERQPVPDVDGPFAKAFVAGLGGAADRDGDGLILGSELSTYVRAEVAKETRRIGRPNDPVIAFLPRPIGRGDSTTAQKGDFVFLSPRGIVATAGPGAELDTLRARRGTLPPTHFLDCADCPEMVAIPGEPFAMALTEVTYLHWDACYRSSYCATWKDDRDGARGALPVGDITWQDALQFTQWLNRKRVEQSERRADPSDRKDDSPCAADPAGYRLPTKWEWTYAAVKDKTTRFPWGTEVGSGFANCWDCGSKWDRTGPAPVGSFAPTAFGLRDMVGNLWEWVSDGPVCTAQDVLDNCKDGRVMGGAYSTASTAIKMREGSPLPRTSNNPAAAYHLPTVGLRVACTIRVAA